jgi:hypothetical protein
LRGKAVTIAGRGDVRQEIVLSALGARFGTMSYFSGAPEIALLLVEYGDN